MLNNDMAADRSYKGRYRIKNLEKYRGNPDEVVYRSLWERRLCVYFDTNPDVLEWSIEPFPISYLYPIDNKNHRYWIDFWVKLKDKNGEIREKLIEVKPEKYTKPPEKKKKITQRYIEDVETWIKNNAKWTAAKKLCEEKNWDFMILTEKHIFGRKK